MGMTRGSVIFELEEADMKYRVILEQSEEGVAAYVPGLPGCWSQGESEAEALDNIRWAIAEYLEVVTVLRSSLIR
jgi:predicted RNase H-like HicB family nuclease